jgi:CTP-dependent riboflavin kinase
MAKGRLSDEYVAVAIMQHLTRRKDAREGACTAHYLMRIESIINSQRQQRIERILAQLLEWGYVIRIRSTAGTLYEVSERGYNWYKSEGRSALELIRRFYR